MHCYSCFSATKLFSFQKPGKWDGLYGTAYTTAMNLAEWGIMSRLLSGVARFELDFAGPYMMYGFNR